MLRRLRASSIVVTVALCTAASIAAVGNASTGQHTHPSTVAPLGGINIGALDYGSRPGEADRDIALAARLHAKVVRTDIPWSVLEPRATGELDPQALAFTDRLVADAAAKGIGVIMTLSSTPCWDSSAPEPLARECSGTERSVASRWPPRDPSDFAEFAALLAKRYGTKLAAIEIWNEPDQANELYFAGPHKVERYAAILRAAYTAIKQADPAVTVLGGSLVGSNGIFLRALYAAGIKGYYDGLAVHFYTLTLAALSSIRRVQLANGDSKPLWLDEFGWSSCWPQYRTQEEQDCVTKQVQAANMASIFRSLATTSYVAAAVIYKLRDSVREDFGVASQSGAAKPAFAALGGVLIAPKGVAAKVTLRLRRTGGRVVASGSGPVGDFIRVEASHSGTLRYRAVFSLDRFNRYSIVLPRVIGTGHLRVRAYEEWFGQGRGAHAEI